MKRRITLTPFVVASDGTLYANVAATKLIQQAQRMNGGLFIGSGVTRDQKKSLLLALDNAGAETVAKTIGRRQRHPTRRPRRSSGRSRGRCCA